MPILYYGSLLNVGSPGLKCLLSNRPTNDSLNKSFVVPFWFLVSGPYTENSWQWHIQILIKMVVQS